MNIDHTEDAQLDDIRDMFFTVAEGASLDSMAFQLTMIINNVGNQLRALMDAGEAKPWNKNFTDSLISGAAAMLLQAEPYINELERRHTLLNGSQRSAA